METRNEVDKREKQGERRERGRLGEEDGVALILRNN